MTDNTQPLDDLRRAFDQALIEHFGSDEIHHDYTVRHVQKAARALLARIDSDRRPLYAVDTPVVPITPKPEPPKQRSAEEILERVIRYREYDESGLVEALRLVRLKEADRLERCQENETLTTERDELQRRIEWAKEEWLCRCQVCSDGLAARMFRSLERTP